MHMADALLSPAVGGTMWAATAVSTVYASKKLKKHLLSIIAAKGPDFRSGVETC